MKKASELDALIELPRVKLFLIHAIPSIGIGISSTVTNNFGISSSSTIFGGGGAT